MRRGNITFVCVCARVCVCMSVTYLLCICIYIYIHAYIHIFHCTLWQLSSPYILTSLHYSYSSSAYTYIIYAHPLIHTSVAVLHIGWHASYTQCYSTTNIRVVHTHILLIYTYPYTHRWRRTSQWLSCIVYTNIPPLLVI